MASTLANALDFFRDFGVFDVILPFLLVFTVVYATLQKTEVLGKNKANLDSMVAFVIGLLVVAATKVVGVINEALPQIMVLVIVGLSFLLMLGIFAKPEGSFFESLEGNFRIGLMIILSAAVVLIFLGVIENSKGETVAFVVRELKSYDRNDNAPEVFVSNDGLSHLNLVTCTGIWNIEEKSRSDRLVIFTDKEIK